MGKKFTVEKGKIRNRLQSKNQYYESVKHFFCFDGNKIK